MLTRAVTTKLSEKWGQPVVVDNRPGANTAIGAEAVAKAPADGYTLLFTTEATLVANPSLYSKLPYDPARDFEPVTMLFSVPYALAVNKTVHAATLREFIELAKSRSGDLTYASPGNGSAAHINFELLNRAAGIDVRHIPYKGAGPAITDLIGGQVGAMLLPTGVASQYVKDGKLRVLAVDRQSDSTLLQSTPNYRDAGLPQFAPLTAWGALVAPTGTPKSIVAKINADVASALGMPEVRSVYAAQGATPIGNSSTDFSQMLKTDAVKWAKGIKDSGAKLD